LGSHGESCTCAETSSTTSTAITTAAATSTAYNEVFHIAAITNRESPA
jgi:hypothetical protein